MARSFFRWAAARCVVLLDPTRDLVVPRVNTLHRAVLSVAEVQALLDAAQTSTNRMKAAALRRIGLRDQALMETLYGTGVRRMECCALDLADVDLREGTLRVKCGKGGDGRVVPMGDSLHILERYIEACRPELNPRLGEAALFLTQQGLRLSYYILGMIVQKLARVAGIERSIGPHDLRRGCAPAHGGRGHSSHPGHSRTPLAGDHRSIHVAAPGGGVSGVLGAPPAGASAVRRARRRRLSTCCNQPGGVRGGQPSDEAPRVDGKRRRRYHDSGKNLH